MILIASKGHLWTHIPQPTQSCSEMIGFARLSSITIASEPVLTGGQYLIHSRLHFFGWQRSLNSIAIRIWIQNCLDIIKPYYPTVRTLEGHCPVASIKSVTSNPRVDAGKKDTRLRGLALCQR